MPTGLRGERRPADVIGNAIMVARLSVGELSEPPKREPGRLRSGQAGGAARASRMTKEERVAIAKQGAAKRWGAKDE
jgi:hypothetical protein